MHTEQSHLEQEPQPRVTVREVVNAQEMSEIRALHVASWLVTYPNEAAGVEKEWVEERTTSWLQPDSIKRSIERLDLIIKDPTQFYRVAEVNDKLAGFVHLSTHEDGTKELEAMYASPEVFGLGVGAKLMEAASEWIGNEDTKLKVATYNARAIRFYEKHGFQEVPDSNDLFADKIPLIVMMRKGVKS